MASEFLLKMSRSLKPGADHVLSKRSITNLLSDRFEETARLILPNGGRVTTDLSDPKLTHVVMDNEHLSRRKELMRLTET